MVPLVKTVEFLIGRVWWAETRSWQTLLWDEADAELPSKEYTLFLGYLSGFLTLTPADAML